MIAIYLANIEQVLFTRKNSEVQYWENRVYQIEQNILLHSNLKVLASDTHKQ